MNPKTYHHISSNPSSVKSRFTRGFLRAFKKIKRQQRLLPTSSSSSSNPSPRPYLYGRVKIAADKSLALAVGSRRAWSRALLWKIHYKAWRQRSRFNNKKKRLKENKKNKKKKKNDDEEVGFRHAKELRKLVPGGKAMDLCSLLDETAHYIKCLITQVQVMKSIDQIYSF
ncbi:hypothetical protein Pint_03084 [Pistacia integerrima]|uniref:Uncharacterized protein n=1 Tax=Pistacia integerrima TaxID=434235 RepID=A0ACC0ZQT2_9ROSI|nr:hypothetical protein Pint_03084 [Pistacia integerrima]